MLILEEKELNIDTIKNLVPETDMTGQKKELTDIGNLEGV